MAFLKRPNRTANNAYMAERAKRPVSESQRETKLNQKLTLLYENFPKRYINLFPMDQALMELINRRLIHKR